MLPDFVRKRIESEAVKRGQDPVKAVAEAERLAKDDGDKPPPSDEKAGRPTFERLLIGVLPFIKVRELRSIWLGLEDRVPDDEMMCGDFQLKHGGGTAGPAAPEPE